jgi:hypothetical protein
MTTRNVAYWLSRRSTLVIAILFLALGVLVAYFLATGFSSQQAQAIVGIAAVSAFFAAVSAVANLLQAVEVQRQRELRERPLVTAYFEGSSKAAVYFVVENSGNSPALDLSLRFEPAPTHFSGRTLDQDSTFARPIPFLPAGKSLRQIIDAGHRFLAEGRPTRFSVALAYSGIQGSSYSDKFDHDVEWMKQATVPEKSIEDHLEEIAKILKAKGQA